MSIPLYKQLYERLRGAILVGQLERGARLPSTRTLASELGVSRTTTALAYEQLLLEGYLESRVGQGTTVARHLPASLVRAYADQTREQHAGPYETPSLRIATRVRPLQDGLYPELAKGRVGGPFRAGEPALDLFPYEVWARLIARHARQSQRSFVSYQSPAGYEPLREAIAAHIGITRGVRCVPEQIIITAGSQGALDLAVRTLLNSGEAAPGSRILATLGRRVRCSLLERDWCRCQWMRRVLMWRLGGSVAPMRAWSRPHPRTSSPQE